MGFKVYVDFMVDPQLDRRSVTKETAECIHIRKTYIHAPFSIVFKM